MLPWRRMAHPITTAGLLRSQVTQLVVLKPLHSAVSLIMVEGSLSLMKQKPDDVVSNQVHKNVPVTLTSRDRRRNHITRSEHAANMIPMIKYVLFRSIGQA